MHVTMKDQSYLKFLAVTKKKVKYIIPIILSITLKVPSFTIDIALSFMVYCLSACALKFNCTIQKSAGYR